MKVRKKPVVVDAILWMGGDYSCLDEFCGRNWTRADAVDMSYEDQEQVVLWNTKERQYLHCPTGHWVIRGIDGELYPCSPDVFDRTYEPLK
jgi:hypothetical protein